MAITKEKFKTYKNVFDEYTNRLVFKLSSEGFFDELRSPIAIGKESNVFSAETKEGKLIIVKIYRVNSCDFNKMFDYIKNDLRYENLKNQKRKVIFSWVQREYRNLMIAREAGVSVPLPLANKDSVLVLEMVGKDSPAPKLKDEHPANPKKFMDKVVLYMKKLHQAGLVHGDLSEFNILNYDEEPYFIDFSQSTVIKSRNYNELLERDVKNICRFFKKLGIKPNEEEVMKKIRG